MYVRNRTEVRKVSRLQVASQGALAHRPIGF